MYNKRSLKMILKKGILGNTIRNSRIENKLTQEELAEIIGITPTHLKHIESEHRNPSIEVLFKLASTLHFSLDELFVTKNSDLESQKLINKIQLILPECSKRELKALLAALLELH